MDVVPVRDDLADLTAQQVQATHVAQRVGPGRTVTFASSDIDVSTGGIWRGPLPVPQHLRGAVVAIGNFDGVHLGHRALLAEARSMADAAGRPMCALTFEPHPRTFFRPSLPVFRLTPADMRASLMAGLGCEGVVELAFDAALSGLDADVFIDDILMDQLGVSGVVVGTDFRFGRGRTGDVAMLVQQLARRGVKASALGAVVDTAGVPISSSRIRDALALGDIAGANAMLGAPWTVRGQVVHGDKRGRLLGFPTANMVLPADNRLRHGIYAVRVLIDGAWHAGVASFGRRPTFDDGAPRLETFVFDFSGDLYGRVLDVAFAGWVRGEEKFACVEALVAQMQRDVEKARTILV